MNEKQTTSDLVADIPVPSEPETLRPTKKQKELLAYIEQFIAEHGYSPSYREIMNGLQYTSVATVALHVGNLIKRGHLRKRDHSARSIEVVRPNGVTPETPLRTNAVKDSEEKWLVGKVEQFVAEAEAEPVPSTDQLRDILMLLSALRVLGLGGAAGSFIERTKALEAKQAKTDKAG